MTAAAETAAGPRDWAAETESRILDEALTLCVHMGWTRPMTLAAGRRCGLSTGETDLLLPHGPRDLAALLSRRHDAVALAALPAPEGLKIRQRRRGPPRGRGRRSRGPAALGGVSQPAAQPAPGAAPGLGKRRQAVALGRGYGDRRESLFQEGHPLGHPDLDHGHRHGVGA
jgi:hypothetical protein